MVSVFQGECTRYGLNLTLIKIEKYLKILNTCTVDVHTVHNTHSFRASARWPVLTNLTIISEEKINKTYLRLATFYICLSNFIPL
jgi:hypothetical protein